LWKIDDACRAKEKNPQDSDIYDSIKSQYETVVENILDRIKDVWVGPEEYESADQNQSNQSQDSSIDWEQVAAELQPEEVITSPQNKQYIVVEVNNPKVKVKESKTGEIFIVDIENALKWKHA
jgi:predicted metal-dependent peptidase